MMWGYNFNIYMKNLWKNPFVIDIGLINLRKIE